MKIEAIVKIDYNKPDKLDCYFYTLITGVENNNIKYAWLDTSNNTISLTWFNTISEARKSLFDYFNGENLFSIEFRRRII